MRTFWKGLARANAKAVFACAVAAFVGVAGWYLWKLAAPHSMASAARSSAQSREDASADLGVFSALDREIGLAATNISPDPFYFVAKAPPPQPQPTRTTETPSPAVRPAPAPTPRPVAETPRPPAPRTIQLIYRGLFVRPDGRTVAIIEDSKTGHGMTATNGTRLFGLELSAISNDLVCVRAPDGSEVTICRGETKSFPER